MAAATLNDAACDALFEVEEKFFALTSMTTLLNAWIAALAAAGIPDDQNGRTVLNWIPVGKVLVNSLASSSAQGLFNSNEVGIYVYRTCRAAQFAETAGRITAGQAAAILASFNSIIA